MKTVIIEDDFDSLTLVNVVFRYSTSLSATAACSPQNRRGSFCILAKLSSSNNPYWNFIKDRTDSGYLKEHNVNVFPREIRNVF